MVSATHAMAGNPLCRARLTQRFQSADTVTRDTPFHSSVALMA